eukprot:TRINITY_DN8840_c0_g1_i1.p1 TRINITY_DN8840_c0_g1~~TRINITY_DN8840_c0_g1_i1.p1  ORF type:complete len:184 (+),score=82.21 TRINITY_DN8840_c0_g1_i1:66-554(+)
MDSPEPGATSSALPFSEKTIEAQERHQKLLDQLEREKRARQIAVPTKDAQVKEKLRELGEPICLFAEEPPERRNRLREVLARLTGSGTTGTTTTPTTSTTTTTSTPTTTTTTSAKVEEGELFYTEGSAELRAARQKIAVLFPRSRSSPHLSRKEKKRGGGGR